MAHETVFPIDAAPYRLSRLPIGQASTNCNAVTSVNTPGDSAGARRTPNPAASSHDIPLDRPDVVINSIGDMVVKVG